MGETVSIVTAAAFLDSRELVCSDREKDRTVEKTHMHVSHGSYDTGVVWGSSCPCACLEAVQRVDLGWVLGKRYIEISQGRVPCSKQIPE